MREAPAGPPAVHIDLECDAHVNYAMHQNAVPTVRLLRVRNEGADDLEDIEVTVSATPEIADPLKLRVARIPAGASHLFPAVDLQLNAARLAVQSERERGALKVEVRHGGEVLASCTQSLDVLAYNEWAGAVSLPEILAAFVLPNHPEIAKILGHAAELLQQRTGRPDLDGYQSRDPRRVWAMTEAIHQAIVAAKVTYINPPASFEQSGQKIRTPDQILETGMATCLDLTLLYAACFEQVGLHALLVLLDGHSFVGCWLEEDTFPQPVTDEPLRLRKRVDLQQIMVLETTLATKGKGASHGESVARAASALQDPSKFRYLVDVAASRRKQIRPLPLRTQDEGAMMVMETGVATLETAPSAQAPGDPALHQAGDVTADGDVGATGRMARWKRKLLDLSLRNRLINFRETKQSIPIECPDLGGMEDQLADGGSYTIQPRPESFEGVDPRSAELLKERGLADAYEGHLKQQFAAHRIYARVGEDELAKRLVKIDRAARLSMEEGGANTLYLALGFLTWYEAPSSERQRRAPVLLLPLVLERESMSKGYSLKLSDEDPIANVTLFQKLNQDFGVEVGGLENLETDESGVDVPAILRRVRKAILDMDRWDVVEEACIGLFSFTKYLMWLDLDKRGEDLRKNGVVKHLIDTPQEPYPSSVTFGELDRLDQERSPADSFCPKDADSSQLNAVFAAADGGTFVLQGPPGTGKSQTITNIIAHSLAKGKRVLFVSEKMAALNVVHRRLEDVGLGPFCLEMHSNKVQKHKVLEQLGRSLDFRAPANEKDWESRSRSLEKIRGELNAYSAALHAKHSFGESVYQALGRLVALRGEPKLSLDLGDPDKLTPERRSDLQDIVREMGLSLGTLGSPAASAFRDAGDLDWTPGLQESIREAAAQLEHGLESWLSEGESLGSEFGFELDSPAASDLVTVQEVGRLLCTSPGTTKPLASDGSLGTTRARIEEWVQLAQDAAESAKTLERRYSPEFLQLDHADLRRQWERVQRSSRPLSWLRGRGPKAVIRATSNSGRVGKPREVIKDLRQAVDLRDLRDRRASCEAEAQGWLAEHWRGEQSDFDHIRLMLAWASSFQAAVARAAGADIEKRRVLRGRWLDLLTDGADLLQEGGPLYQKHESLVARAETVTAGDARLLELLRSDAGDGPDDANPLRTRIDGVQGIQRRLAELRPWCTWRRARQNALDAGIPSLVEALESGAVRPTSIRDVFERAFYEWWIGKRFELDVKLRQFDSGRHNDLVRRFQNLDIMHIESTHDVVRGKLSKNMPRGQHQMSTSSTSQMGLLQRELMKKRRHMPIRKLFERISDVVIRLKPCMLMSPLSVAQYLGPNFPPFDLVVFDEASQIPVWDAIGAIARGEQLVVVGDPKQLPPTNFFMKSDDEESLDEDDVEDLESILDECIGARLPVLDLGWHYRSRHESLIAFSNHHYYNNRLLTFPAAEADVPTLGVQSRHIEDGVYDRGKSRANRAEAQAVVEFIVDHYNDPDSSQLSIGVVTFSQAQQGLVEDLLDEARRRSPPLDAHFSSESDEPVFVKNLENVQGDERDVILFSICYGPDQQGRVAMNFGPLNRDGGERRLNVAVTRARTRLVVFSSLHADQIDLARTRAVGVRHLKQFLDYAQRGAKALESGLSVDTGADWDSDFERQVHEALESKGWEVVPQVGCSGYRIDLSVKDPTSPGRFLAGIECDGAMYHSGKTARDRDRLRQAVLESLGWTIERIWSTDWWMDPEGQLERVHARLEELRARSDDDQRQRKSAASVPSPLFASSSHMSAESAPAPAELAESSEAGTSAGLPYVIAELRVRRGDKEAFYSSRSTRHVQEQVQVVLTQEAPIANQLLARRIGDAWGLVRRTPRFLDQLQAHMRRIPGMRQVNGESEIFWWEQSQDPEAYTIFRVPAHDGDNARKAEEIAPQEIANAAAAVLHDHVSMPTDDLCRETARTLGFSRVGKKVKDAMEQGLQHLALHHRIEVGSTGDIRLI